MATLLDAGADPDLRDTFRNGWPSLIHAVHRHQTGAVRLLLDRGADPDRTTWNGLTPLMMAAAEADLKAVRNLLGAGADPHAESLDGLNALTTAVAGGDAEAMRAILAAAPDLRWRSNIEGFGARAIATVCGNSEVLALLDQVLERQRRESSSTNRRTGA